MDDIQLSELHEAIAHLGNSHYVGEGPQDTKKQYFANREPCLASLKDLTVMLKHDRLELGHPVRVKLGELKVLPDNLVPLFQAFREDPDIAMATLRLMVLLTQNTSQGDSRLELLRHLQDCKEAFAKKDVFIIFMGILIENMEDDEEGADKDKDGGRQGLFDLVLELLRNLTAVPDPGPGDAGFTPSRGDLQKVFIQYFVDEGVLDLLQLFAEGLVAERATERKAWTLCDIVYRICTHTDPEVLTSGTREKDKNALKDLFAREQADTRLRAPVSSRHSNFGTAMMSRTAEGGMNLMTSVLDTTTVTKGGRVWRKEYKDPLARNEKKVNMFHDPFFVDLEEGSVKDHNLLNPHVRSGSDAARVMGEAVASGLRKFFEEFLPTAFSPLIHILRSTLGNPNGPRPVGFDVDENRPGGPFDRMKLLNTLSWFLEFHRHHHSAAVAAAKKAKENAPIIDIASIQGGIDLDMIQFVAARLREYGKESNMHASHLVVTLRSLAQQIKTVDVVVESKDQDTRDCGEILTQSLIKENIMANLAWVMKNYKTTSHDPRIMSYAVEVLHYILRLMRTLSERRGQKLEFQVEIMGRTLKRTTTTMEQELARLADAQVVENLFHLLEKYKRHSAALNSMLVKLIYSIIRVQRENIVVFFELTYFIRIQRIWADPLVRDRRQGKRYQEMVTLLQFILRQFFKCVETNKCAFVELLFRKVPESQKEALLQDHTAEFAAILDHYENEEYKRVLEKMGAGDSVKDLKNRQRMMLDGSLPWTEQEDQVLRDRFPIYAQHPLCAELLAAELPEDTRRTGANVRKRLVELGILSSGRQAGAAARTQNAAPKDAAEGEPAAKRARVDGGDEGVGLEGLSLENELDRLLDEAMEEDSAPPGGAPGGLADGAPGGA
eukprot:CAMPEP_0198551132 /NCGR_PEP_ID=MMETSP1462-20131121/76125_1 /TAXON_ID=1333877 /ORGANISM="Brandtodinium nutriculum, Strain RCC3387" /LENGTH=892 /DNA_ID=CAMNT_0044281767 /DNA_START=16 /DNA_END=2690 /DNA_ORIENTATION=-